MNAYVQDTKKAIEKLDGWVGDIEGVVHPDLLDAIQTLMSEADMLCDQHNSVIEDNDSFKDLLSEHNIEY